MFTDGTMRHRAAPTEPHGPPDRQYCLLSVQRERGRERGKRSGRRPSRYRRTTLGGGGGDPRRDGKKRSALFSCRFISSFDLLIGDFVSRYPICICATSYDYFRLCSQTLFLTAFESTLDGILFPLSRFPSVTFSFFLFLSKSHHPFSPASLFPDSHLLLPSPSPSLISRLPSLSPISHLPSRHLPFPISHLPSPISRPLSTPPGPGSIFADTVPRPDGEVRRGCRAAGNSTTPLLQCHH